MLLRGCESRHPTRLRSDDAATSTAPQIGRKRRLSTQDDERESTPAKKARADSEAPTDEQEQDRGSSPVAPTDTEEVKEVTQGVRDVELEDGKSKPVPIPVADEAEGVKEAVEETPVDASTSAQEAAAVPLPESPTLKAAEGEDQDVDAEGELDIEAKEDEIVAPATSPVEQSSKPAPVSTADEVPGLTLAASPSKHDEKTTTES